MDSTNSVFNEALITRAIEAHSEEANETILDEDKFERLIQRIEKQLKTVPAVGKYASDIACLVSLVKHYVKKEYTDIPISAVVLMVAALIYIVSAFDLIPDIIPALGYIDDIAVLLWALKTLHTELEDFKKWRKDNGKQLFEEV